jgi:hypothetical protein
MQQKVVVHCSLPGDSALSCNTLPRNGTYLKRKKKVLIGYGNYTWHQGTICDEIQVSKLLLVGKLKLEVDSYRLSQSFTSISTGRATAQAVSLRFSLMQTVKSRVSSC